MTALRDLRGLIVIDEAQRMPDLFPVLRVLADRDGQPARFLILGSTSPALAQQSAESLAGRKERIKIGGFSLPEVGIAHQPKHWLRGGLPRSFLAGDDAASSIWRPNFIGYVVERDLPELGMRAPPMTIFRFWSMVAHFHGQIWNGAELARALGLSQPMVRRYLVFLSGTFMVRQLQPWFENLGKRQVRSPKLTPSIRAALSELNLDELIVVYQGDRAYDVAGHVRASAERGIVVEPR